MVGSHRRRRRRGQRWLSSGINGEGQQWVEFRDRYWPHKDIGWVLLHRNPFSPDDRPRFLISVGGFQPQGLAAAMRKRMQISKALVDVRGQLNTPSDEAVRARLRCNPDPHEATDFRFRDGDSEDCFLPAHIVKAKPEMTPYWLCNAPPPDEDMRRWTDTTASFDGVVRDYEAVTAPIT